MNNHPSSLPPLAVTSTPIPTTLAPAHNPYKWQVDTSPLAKNTHSIAASVSVDRIPIAAPAPENELDFSKEVIYGSATTSAPTPNYTQQERTQRIDAYSGRVVSQINNIESGSEGERNIKFQKVRQFLEPAGYFSGGLLAAGYDPHEKITVTFTSYVGKGKPETLTNTDKRTYFAWEIAAGALAHDKVERGGPIDFQFMEIENKDRSKVADLEAQGKNLQNQWENEVSKPMRDDSGALAKRSGQADAYVVRGILQSLANNKDSFEKLSSAGQEAVKHTLQTSGQVIIPNIYGYPLSGYAFIPYTPFDGNDEHRPNKGVMLDLKNGAAHEIQGDSDFANWAKNNRDNLQRSFNARDRQGGHDVHWPKACDVLNNLIVDPHATYQGRSSLLADKAVPVRETFNYTESRGSAYLLKFGNLGSGLEGKYQEVNAKNAVWSDQTEVFGSSQQNWKFAKDLWGSTFGYIPLVGNTGNLVFGIHDSIYGMTANDRVGGNAAAVISGLQLAHELAPVGVEAGIGEPPTASATAQNYRWNYNSETRDFELAHAPKTSNDTDAASVGTQDVPKVDPTPTPSAFYPGMQEVQYKGKTYLAAYEPDGGDGEHFLLRVPDPQDRSKLVSSTIIAKPDKMGVWNRRGEEGGARWPWQHTASPTPSHESTKTPKFSERFIDSKGSKISGAEKFDDYLNLDENKQYAFNDDVYEEGSKIKRKLSISWVIDDGNFAVTEGEKAQPDTGYSTSFAPDLNRETYSIIKRENGNTVRIELDFKSASADETIKRRLERFEETIPDAELRARISEVAHQGASFPAFVELTPPTLKEDYSVSAGRKYFTIEYDPALNTHTVKATTQWVLKLQTEDGMVPNRDLDITSTRIFTIRESNELQGNAYTIDRSAPTQLEITTPTHI